jgi:thymidylate synthase (FAD)
MVNVCVEINTTRDIARQILRHRSFSFQEFSQRYAEALGFERSEVRLQDHKNRQNSIHTADSNLRNWWDAVQDRMMIDTQAYYQTALAKGVAKEVARKILPEGLTMSKMYMNGTLRSWVHFLQIRCDSATQKEHRDIAMQCGDIIRNEFPNVMEALIE